MHVSILFDFRYGIDLTTACVIKDAHEIIMLQRLILSEYLLNVSCCLVFSSSIEIKNQLICFRSSFVFFFFYESNQNEEMKTNVINVIRFEC